ncbi:MAG: DNA internalization-related competence protein ComEC/Rec2, partial [Bacillota bacterium]
EGLLALPRPPGNPGEFNYAAYLESRGVQAVMRARRVVLLPGPPAGWAPVRLALALRRSLEGVLASALPDRDAALMRGLLLGGASDLDPQVAEDFRVAGLYHVLAVSGSNVAFVALPVLAALTRLWGRRPALAGTAVVVAGYVLVTGATPSVLRAGVMAIAVLAGEAFGRGGSGLASLSAAAFFLLVRNPGTLQDPGFQLSFAATAGILTLVPPLQARLSRLPAWIQSPLAVTVAAQVAVLPLSLLFWQGVSLISLVANLMAAPLVEALVWMGSALVLVGEAFLPLAAGLAGPVRLTLAALTGSMHLLAAVPLAYLTVPTPGLIQVAAYYAALTLAVVRPSLPRRALVALVAAALLLAAVPAWWQPRPRGLEATFLDVGQGDAAVVRLPDGKTMLVDGGGWQEGASSVDWDPGAEVVAPFLRRQGIRRIDVLVATHPHADHVGGLSAVIGSFAVGEVWLGVQPSGAAAFVPYQSLLQAAAARGLKMRFVKRGDEYPLGGAHVLLLGPPATPYRDQRSNENANSVTLLLTYGRSSLVLMADAEAPVERDLLDDPALRPRLAGVSLLKAGHHGSRYASSADWVRTLQPAFAVISVGRNSFGHPAPETLQTLRLNGPGRPVLRTDWDGAVIFRTDGSREEVLTVRSTQRWRRAAGDGAWEPVRIGRDFLPRLEY